MVTKWVVVEIEVQDWHKDRNNGAHITRAIEDNTDIGATVLEEFGTKEDLIKGLKDL